MHCPLIATTRPPLRRQSDEKVIIFWGGLPQEEWKMVGLSIPQTPQEVTLALEWALTT